MPASNLVPFGLVTTNLHGVDMLFFGGVEGGRLFIGMIPGALKAEGVTVIIGSDNQNDLMSDCSAVLTRYGVPGVMEGVVGAFGPARLDYERAIATVGYVSGTLSQLVGGFRTSFVSGGPK